MSSGLNPQAPPPLEFICPITQDIMKDPVIDNEGVSYERSAIEEWLNRGNSTSPATNRPLRKEDLRANLALRSQIESFLDGNLIINNPSSTSSSSSTTDQGNNNVPLIPKILDVKITKSKKNR